MNTSPLNGEFIPSVFDRRRSEKRLAEENIKSFTSEKLDLLEAMHIDPRLSSTDFKVAFCLVQHVNSKTGQCNPSQRLIQEYCSLKERTVRNSITRLRDAKWLHVYRPGRGSNRYRFDDANVSAMLDRRTSIRDQLNLERSYRHQDAAQEA